MIGQRAVSKQAERRHQETLSKIQHLEVLPTTCSIPLRMLELQRSSSASVAQFAEALTWDASLCTKVLGLANSAWFSPTRPITKVSDAITMIGLRHLMPLVFASSIAGIYDQLGLPLSIKKRLWESALLKGVASRECARRYAPARAEEAFICGLIQDIVLPLVCAVDVSSWPEVDAVLDSDPDQRSERERSIYGGEHAEMGQELAERLGLPAFYQDVTRAHHDGSELYEAVGDEGLGRSLELSALLPHNAARRKRCFRRLIGFFQREDNAADLDVAPAGMLTRIEEQYGVMLKMMGDDGGLEGHVKDFLQQAANVLAGQLQHMIGESNMLVSTFEGLESNLQQKIDQLKQRATESDYDGLTGILNRRGFLDTANIVFAKARDLGFGCAVGFVDLDDFKGINDQYGHAMGDLALKAAAETLLAETRGCGIAGRFGGDEFTLVLVAEDRARASELMARIASSLGDLTVSSKGVSLRVGASVGLVWLGTPGPGQTLEGVLHEADKLMYEAKRSGGAKCVLGDCPSPGDAG